MADQLTALLVDLNNFARYPTLAIGYLVAALRRADIEVEVLSPLSRGLPATTRERQERLRDQVVRRLYFSTHPVVARSHDLMWAMGSKRNGRVHPVVLKEVEVAFERRRPDVLLLSAYLDHYESVVALAAIARVHDVPVLLGGPIFNVPSIAREWTSIPGITAIIGAEVDLTLPQLVQAAVSGADLADFPGTFLPDGRSGVPARPLANLDALPVPDFSDFPWERYPTRIIPVMAARGCGWGECTFCADVKTANGRTFRARPLEAVLSELEEQSARYQTRDFIFLDIKLNSDLGLWRGLIDGIQTRVPGARWIGVVHVQDTHDNGLTREEVYAARAAGLSRVTFGLETGSQRLANAMAKGTRVERSAQFVRDAHEAGISVRATAFVGYPRETASDLDATYDFLRVHRQSFDRIRLGLFKAIPGTRFQQLYDRNPDRYPGLTRFEWDFRHARASFRYTPSLARTYRKSKTRLLNLVYEINRRPLRAGAEVFDGLM